jgi:tRNA nucleotidyltransferase (CCA-adding enzyme)
MAMPPIAPPEVPVGAQTAMDRLTAAGFETWLVGEAVRVLLGGGVPREFELITDAPEPRVLEIFEDAVPTAPAAHRASVPTREGPVDIVSLPAGVPLRRALDHRDFTIRAIAWDPRGGAWMDPHDGRSDLAKGLLRAVGDAEARLAEDPCRALRAARLVAQHGLEVDAGLVSAMRRLGRGIEAGPRIRLRDEVVRLMAAPRVDAGLRLLRETRIERTLAPGVAPDAPDIVARLPVKLPLRLAGWLQGAHPIRVLRRLRIPRQWVTHIEVLLRLHPIERSGARPHDRRRLASRHAAEVDDLISLRRAEIAARGEGERAEAALSEVEAGIERFRALLRRERERPQLAVDGRAIMEHLACGPGRHVGEALRHLHALVADDPSRNERATLLAELDAWSASR